MNKAVLPKIKMHADILVRAAATGLPRFDDPENVPKGVKLLLTLDDLTRLDRDVINKLGLDEVLDAINKELK